MTIAKMIKSVLTLFLLAFASACQPSAIVPKGCRLPGSDASGVDVHYALTKNNSLVTFALRAQTTGYVAISFVKSGQSGMFPADAVAGWAGEKSAVMGYAVNGYDRSAIGCSGVVLYNVSATKVNGTTTVRFTRATNAGRFPIKPESATFNLAQGSTDGLSRHTRKSTVMANLLAGRRVVS